VWSLIVTFFGQAYGFIVFRSPALKKETLLLQTHIPKKPLRVSLGRISIENRYTLSANCFRWQTWSENVFSDIPVQMCHFHQKQIVRRYLTCNPILEAGIELKAIADTLCHSDEKLLQKKLDDWHKKWIVF